jgi:signal peptidase I
VAAERERGSTAGGSLLELVLIVAVALGLALGIQAFLVKPYRIPSESMVPTLQIGQRVLVNRIGDRFGDPHVGDVVVFHPPVGAEQGNQCGGGEPPAGQVCLKESSRRAKVNFIKRVVAGPGDRIFIRDGHVYRNGKRQNEPFAEPCGGTDGCDLPREVTVPAGHYFMMGDNRGSSDDSRFWGPVPRDWVIGQAFATYWPPKRIGAL